MRKTAFSIILTDIVVWRQGTGVILYVQVGNFKFARPSQWKLDVLGVNSSCLFSKLVLVLKVSLTLSLTVVIQPGCFWIFYSDLASVLSFNSEKKCLPH